MAKQEVKQVKTIKSREELIEDIINAGKSIINNADSILGNEKYFLNCKVTFTNDRNINNIPTISSNGDGTYDICNVYFYTNKYTAQSMIENKSIREFFDDILLEKPGNINVSYINQLGGE